MRGSDGGGEPLTGAGEVMAVAFGPPGGGTAMPPARIPFTTAASCAAADPAFGPSGAQGEGGGTTPADGLGDGARDDRPAWPISPPKHSG